MSIRVKLTPGQKFGELVYIGEAGFELVNGYNIRYLYIKCHCGKIMKSRYTSLYFLKSCGCIRIKKLKEHATTHNMSTHPLYKRWADMKSRCINKNSERYNDYGGRDIKVCEEWVNDFKAFYDYVVRLPHYGDPKMTIDRIDNDGDYDPGNVQWATPHQQMANKRLSKLNKSGYKGIRKRGNSYNARITVNHKEYNLGHFKTLEEAINAREKHIKDNKLFEYRYG